jgi:Polyketide cyclase / dehydrase and lipid transport
MPTIHKKIEIEQSKEFVWDAIRDVGSIHRRLVPGFVVDCRLEVDSRIVTFQNGMVVRELIVDVNDAICRHSWSARGRPFTHHNAAIQVFAISDDRCRVVWTADFLPQEVGPAIDEMIQQALSTMKKTLEAAQNQA